MTEYYAHSRNKMNIKHRLSDHLSSVNKLASNFLADTRLAEEAALAGLLHDLGKYGDLFQARLKGETQGIDHWSSGAWLAISEYRAIVAALAIEGHHIGLQHFSKNHLGALDPKLLEMNHPLQLRLSETNLNDIKSRMFADGINPSINHSIFGNKLNSTISTMLDVRMIFSALVDADFLDTEAHFNGTPEGKQYRQPGPELQAKRALELLLDHIKEVQARTQAAQKVTDVRSSLLDSCLNTADSKTGLFTLTAPTGSGKTLSMLAFALKHAIERLRRIIIVLPYLSIIEQTASIYREIFESHFGRHYVLEHHSLAEVGVEKTKSDNEGNTGEQEAAERQRRLLAENWDAPIIVTTSVQMLESLFSNRPSACRKLHRLTRSVVLFDEVQTLSASLAVPTLAALSHLAYAYGSSVVFSTATQPAFEHLHETVKSHSATGWQVQKIVSETQSLFDSMKRTHVFWGNPDEGISWDSLACHLKEHKQALCIVNLKRHARVLWEKVGDEAYYLSTNLCPAHRRVVLDTVCKRLLNREPVHLIATQCIEAGVDVDFPVVYRAYAPLEAIIQAAGRCNREGRQENVGQVHVFLPLLEGNENEFPDDCYKQAAQITKMLFRRYGAEKMLLDDPDFITDYYHELYDISKPEAMNRTQRLLKYVTAGSFPDIAKEYRLIKQDAINVLVPYQPPVEEFKELCENGLLPSSMKIFDELYEKGNKIGLTSEWIRHARPFTVSIYRPKPDDTIWDSLIPVKVAGRKDKEQNDWFVYIRKEDYHPVMGLTPSGSLNVWIG
ncbi:MAG: CRISPR-associated helicase Cas3' [Candidatus Brocadiaceae bacterium]|nr:CRISPR-associated helicase Cas3' [Candidatus Brocadiaceae bacterium]